MICNIGPLDVLHIARCAASLPFAEEDGKANYSRWSIAYCLWRGKQNKRLFNVPDVVLALL